MRLHDTMDAKVWADDFNVVLVSKGEQPFDPGWLIGWFANAIMCGWDHAYWKLQPALDDARALLAKYEEVNAVLVKALEYCAIEPESLHPENNRQCAVAQNALASAAALRGEKGEKEESL